MASGSAGSLVVSLGLNAAEFFAGLTKSEYQAKQFANQLKKSVDGAVSSLKLVAGAVGIPLGLHALLSTMESLKDKAAENERSFQQLDAVLKSTGASAGLTKAALADIGKGLEARTVFDDDDIRKAQVALLQFGAIDKDVFTQALSLSADLAARMGTDLPEAAAKIRKALVDPERGLRVLKQAGVELSQQNIDLAARFKESGDRAQANALVLSLLEKSIGGAAAGDNAGLYGASKRLTRSWEDLQKALGHKIFDDQGSQIDKLTGFYDKLIERLNNTRIKFSDLFSISRTQQIQKGFFKDFTTSFSPDYEEPAKHLVGGKISGLGPEDLKAQEAAKTALLKEQEEKRYDDMKIALQKRADSAATFYAKDYAYAKSALGLTTEALEFSYSQNEQATANYYDARKRLAQADLEEQIKYINLQVSAQEKIRTAVIPGTSQPAFDAKEREAALQKEIALINQGQQLRFDTAGKLQKLDQDQAVAVKKLTEEYDDLNAQLLEVYGNTVAAANAQFTNAHRDQIERIKAGLSSPDAGDQARAAALQAQLDQLREYTDIQAKLREQARLYEGVLGKIGIAQGYINIAQSTGAISEVDALYQTSELNKSKLETLQRIAFEYAKIASSPFATPEQIQQAEAMKLKIAELAAQTDLLADKFNKTFGDAFASAVSDVATGAKSVKDAFNDMAKSITKSIADLAAQDVASRLFGKGAPLSGIGEMLSKLFGASAKTGTAPQSGGGIGDFFSKLFGGGAAGKVGEVTSTVNPEKIAADAANATLTSATELASSAVGMTTASTGLITAGTSLLSAAVALNSAAAALLASSTTSSASSIGGLAGLFGSSGGGLGEGGYGLFDAVSGYASGTSYARGGRALVGERGPEEVYLPSGSRVVSNEELMARRNAKNYVFNQSFQIMPGATTASARQTAGMVRDAVQKSVRDR